MRIIPIGEQQFLDDFVARQPRSSFLQSWRWGEFQERVGRKVFRFGVENDGHLIASAQIVEHRLAFGFRYWYCGRGPVVDERLPAQQYRETLHHLLEEIQRLAENQGMTFLRIEPAVEKQTASAEVFRAVITEAGARPTKPIQPAATLLLDLSKREEDLLVSMHEKTRYNIRLAERKDVHVRIANDRIENFLQLNRETTRRDRFQSHPDDYYRTMVKTLLPVGALRLYIAEFEEKTIAAHLTLRFGDTTTYLHGASSDRHRNVMAPHLLHWQEIKDAKVAGSKWFDFWGVSDENPRWEGITRFKRGFGGTELSYLSAFDLPLKLSQYRLYRLAKLVT